MIWFSSITNKVAAGIIVALLLALIWANFSNSRLEEKNKSLENSFNTATNVNNALKATIQKQHLAIQAISEQSDSRKAALAVLEETLKITKAKASPTILKIERRIEEKTKNPNIATIPCSAAVARAKEDLK